MSNTTIFALSTPTGRSGTAIIRISGPMSKRVYQKLCKSKNIEPRRATFSKLYDNKIVIDEVVVIYYKAPNSFTGEDVIEFQTHGAPTIIRKTLQNIENIPNCSFALPGEFSKRAFLNNKMNLLKAEGLNQLINSETELQRKLAANQTFGKALKTCENWRRRLITIYSYIDAFIDFSEEDAKIDLKRPKHQIEKIIEDIDQSLAMYKKIRQIVSGTKIVIFGPPNAGKSTLFNLINNEEKSIVTNIKGTTRDLIESTNDINGNKITLVDTAGLRKTENLIEQEGISKMKKSLNTADLLILVLSPDCYLKKNIEELKKQLDLLKDKKMIVVFNKIDIKTKKGQSDHWRKVLPLVKKPYFSTSCVKKKEYINMYERIIEFIDKSLVGDTKKESNNLLFGELRHYDHLKKMKNHLSCALNMFSRAELAAEEVRLALKELESILGVVDGEIKLDLIFSKFCIGK